MLSVCEALNDARVLVVEDDASIRAMMGYIFKTRGACPVCVESGEEGWNRFLVEPYDLIWLDLRLPGMDGLTLLRHIRAHDPFARVVVMTAHDDANVYLSVMTSGAVALVRKPFSVHQILAASQKALTERG